MPSKHKKLWAAYDVETEFLHYEVRGGWDNPSGFGFTVGSVVDNEGNVRVFSAHGDANAREAMAAYLLEYERIVSFNGIRFDNAVLAAGDDIVLEQLNEKSWDMKALLEKAIGVDDAKGPHIISLEGVSTATIGAKKTLEDGREAVRLWRKGRFKEVVKYNLQDTNMTVKVWEFALRNGYVLFEPARVPLFMVGPEGSGPLWTARLVVKVRVDWKR